MVEYNIEYFSNNYYFLLKEGYDKISLFYSVAETLTESRKKDKKIVLNKKNEKNIKGLVSKFLKTNKKFTEKQINSKFKDIDSEGEIDELVDDDLSFLGSAIPIKSLALASKKPFTMDQTITMARTTNDPVTRGYRVYYGEGTENKENVVSEINYVGVFGREETEFLDYDDTVDTLEDMGVDNAEERAEEMGKLPKQTVKKDKKGRQVLKQRLVEKEPIDEVQKQQMIKMVEDILTKKSKKDGDVVKSSSDSNKTIGAFLKRNIKSIKKLAEKEGISVDQLIKVFKYDE
jgi:hypothetical protein